MHASGWRGATAFARSALRLDTVSTRTDGTLIGLTAICQIDVLTPRLSGS